MIGWLARENNGRIYLFKDEPKLVYVDLDTSTYHNTSKYNDTSTYHSTGRHTYEWDLKQEHIELHPNTYLKVQKGTKHKIECKINLI